MVIKECFLKQLDWKGGGGGVRKDRDFYRARFINNKVV